MENKAYTLKDIAKKLDVHINTVRKEVKQGRLKAVKVGNKYIVSDNNFNNYIDGVREESK